MLYNVHCAHCVMKSTSALVVCLAFVTCVRVDKSCCSTGYIPFVADIICTVCQSL